MTVHLVHVSQNLRERHPIVDQNVSVTANAQATWRASTENAKILVQVSVDLTLNVELSVIHRIASVLRVTLAILSRNAAFKKSLPKLSILVTLLLVE